MEKNTELLSKALRLLPEVKNTVVHPNEGQEYSKPLGKGDSVRIDFGRHLVGHLKLKLGYTDSHPDAPVEMVTPYIYHYYIEALLKCGAKDEALAVMKNYWGGMAELGADTFWELWRRLQHR